MTLQEITEKSLSEAMNLDICMPSDYLKIFSEFLEDGEVEIDELVRVEVERDLKKSKEMIEKTKDTISDAIEIAEEAKSPEDFKKDMAGLVEKLNVLTKALYTDDLTGAQNRKWLFDKFVSFDKIPYDCSVAFIDLNDFKQINDTYGHNVGDATLKFFVNFLRESLVGDDIVRYAGDEFVIVSRTDGLEARLRQARKEITRKKLSLRKNNVKFSVDFSYGMVLANVGDEASDVFQSADDKMYAFKKEAKAVNGAALEKANKIAA